MPEEVKETEEERLRKLRETYIEGMRLLVVEKPDQYDADRLDEAIDLIKSTPDDNLDALIIMGKHMSILCKQVEFSKEEVDRLYDMLRTNFNIVEDEHCEQDDRSRDDYQFLVTTDRSDHVVVWVSKAYPYFADEEDTNDFYQIEAYGCSLYSMCDLNFDTMDEMLTELKKRIEDYVDDD